MKNILLTTLLLIIAGLIIWDIFFRIKPIPEPIIDYQYITDTIWDSIPYAVPEPYPVYTPPRTVTIHVADSQALKDYELRLNDQDLLISSLDSTIRVHELYLKQYPANPKLLAIDLKKDSMSVGLLNITGIPQEDKWPIDLARFNYRWTNDADLSRSPTLTPPTLEKPFAEYFVGGGVDLLYLSPYLSGRAEKDWARIRLYGDVQVGLLKKESSGIRVGIDYKLNGANRYNIR